MSASSTNVPERTILIVGAGIAGLTCGVALLQNGWLSVTILEADLSQVFRLQGFHYHVHEDQSLDHCLSDLGLLEDVRAMRIRNDGHEMALADAANRRLLTWDGRNECAIGDISRGELRDLLLRRFQESGGVVRFGAKVVRVTDSGDHAVAHLHDGTTVIGLLLVGADGVYSSVRTSMLGDCLRLDPSVLSVRGRCENHGQLQDWVRGRQVRFLVVAHRSGSAFFISFYHGHVVWVAMLRGHAKQCRISASGRFCNPSQSEVLQFLNSQGRWHQRIYELVAEADDFHAEVAATVDARGCMERLLCLKPGRIVLISDALHALGGGGAAWAIRDGWSVAAEIVDGVHDAKGNVCDLTSKLPSLHAFELEGAVAAMEIEADHVRFWRCARWLAFLLDAVVALVPRWILRRPLCAIATRLLGTEVTLS